MRRKFSLLLALLLAFGVPAAAADGDFVLSFHSAAEDPQTRTEEENALYLSAVHYLRSVMNGLGLDLYFRYEPGAGASAERLTQELYEEYGRERALYLAYLWEDGDFHLRAGAEAGDLLSPGDAAAIRDAALAGRSEGLYPRLEGIAQALAKQTFLRHPELPQNLWIYPLVGPARRGAFSPDALCYGAGAILVLGGVLLLVRRKRAGERGRGA